MTAIVRVHVIEEHALLAESLVVALTDLGFPADLLRFPPGCVPEQLVAGDTLLLGVDGRLGRTSRMDLISAFSAAGANVIALAAAPDDMLTAMAVDAGAVGVLSRDVSFLDLVTSLRRVANDGTLLSAEERARLCEQLRAERHAAEEASRAFERLTPREREVLTAMLRGKSAKTIAGEMFVTLATVRTQIRSILTKLGVNSQLEAVAFAVEHHWEPDLVPA